ncbi:ATP-binding protein [bacterium]|nr:ATP-binding protein [bacterium]
MIISIASGKGGTGKTTIATNLAYALSMKKVNVTYLDCDVEEPNGHIFLKPRILSRKPVNLPFPVVDQEKCTLCGKCSEICQYSAIVQLGKKILVFSEMCSGCGGCMLVCPEDAISETFREIGVVEIGNSNRIRFVHGILHIGETKAPPVIKEVKKEILNNGVSIIDAPPGTSCPVIESINNADYVILVTEPTPFGLSDLQLTVAVLSKMKIPFSVLINRCDIGDREVHRFCKGRNIRILAEIPDDSRIAKAYSRGEVAISLIPDYKSIFENLYTDIRKDLAK